MISAASRLDSIIFETNSSGCGSYFGWSTAIMRYRLSLAILFGTVAAGSMEAETKAVGLKPNIVVFVGDNVIPQVVDGGGWKTTFKFVNLENYSVTFNLQFIQDNGSPMDLPILGSAAVTPGTFSSMAVSLNSAGSITIETAGTANALTQGWAQMQQTNVNDSIGGLAIFRQRVPGIPDQEAAVPVVNQFSGHFVLLFDNTNFATGIAIANPTNNTVSIPAYIRNEAGQLIDTQFIALGPYEHEAFSVAAAWPSTSGIAGAIEFVTSGFGVGALGLRFNGSAFTSFSVLENYAWIAPQQ
jgi:hypothetical protein